VVGQTATSLSAIRVEQGLLNAQAMIGWVKTAPFFFNGQAAVGPWEKVNPSFNYFLLLFCLHGPESTQLPISLK